MLKIELQHPNNLHCETSQIKNWRKIIAGILFICIVGDYHMPPNHENNRNTKFASQWDSVCPENAGDQQHTNILKEFIQQL